MNCELSVGPVWLALLQARLMLLRRHGDLFFASARGQWSCHDVATVPWEQVDQVLLVRDPRAPNALLPRLARGEAFTICTFRNGSPLQVEHPEGRPVDSLMLGSARVYLPVILGGIVAASRGEVFCVAHVTQSLDGRIACSNGQSQWIGNQADLQHSHRMRALVDAVVVGAGTVLADNPRLTVRLVEGALPRRVVLSGGGRVLKDPRALHVLQAPGCDLFVRHGEQLGVVAPQVKVTAVAAGEDGLLLPQSVQTTLAQAGRHSIFLEGGAFVLSSFLQAGVIDLLQVHIANLLLGSGLPSFSLPAVDHVDAGRRFEMEHSTLDGQLLLSCWPRDRDFCG